MTISYLHSPYDRSTGFTLIELMITLLVAAILFAVAMPSYQSQVRKSRRTEAKTTLLDYASREERYYSAYNRYSSTPADLGLAAFGTVGSGYYTIPAPTITASTGGATPMPATFLFTATPVVGQGQDKDTQCQYFSVDQTGAQTSTDNSAGTGTNTTTTCWR